MEKENLEFLKERLYFLGFGERLNKTLEDKMKAGAKEFKLGIDGTVETMGVKKQVDYVLDFAKSDKKDRYFLNSYTATLKGENNDQETKQKVFLNYGAGLSSRETFNLLDGRSAHKTFKNKEGEPYEAWVKIDFKNQDDYGNNKLKRFSEGWKYDLSHQLHKHPIKELQTATQKEELMRKLKKGDLVEVNFVIDKQDVKRHVAANPADRNILVYDESFKLLNKQKEKKETKEGQEIRPDRSSGIMFNESRVESDSTKAKTKDKTEDKSLAHEGAANTRSRKNGRSM
jgi:hypothetical protein